MEIKEFCRLAVENGYKKTNVCTGWDWIKNNLSELDYIFQTPEYLAHNGMKHKCWPLIVGKEYLSEIEQDVLSTAWYLNNDRQHERNRLEIRQKMLADNWQLLTVDIIQQAITAGKKLLLNDNGRMFLLAPKCKRRGYSFDRLTENGYRDAFCKIV
jgi:hypothetical protein